MSLIGKKPSNTFKDLLYCSNSNSGLSTTPNKILSGNGNASSVYLSRDKLKVQPSSDSTENTVIYDANGNALFTVALAVEFGISVPVEDLCSPTIVEPQASSLLITTWSKYPS